MSEKSSSNAQDICLSGEGACSAPPSDFKTLLAAVSSTGTNHPFLVFGGILLLLVVRFVRKYRKSIKERVKMIEEESWIFGAGMTIERTPTKKILAFKSRLVDSSESVSGHTPHGVFKNLSLMEVNPEFRRKYAGSMNFLSLGEYMTSLSPKGMDFDDMPAILKTEIEAGLASALLKTLGPGLGAAMLPVAAGLGPLQSTSEMMVSRMAQYWFTGEMKDGETALFQPQRDRGVLPMSFLTLQSMADMNSKLSSDGTDAAPVEGAEAALSSNDMMEKGEIGFSPSFLDEELEIFAPDKPFVVDKDFLMTIRKMETKLGDIADSDAPFDPEDLSLPRPSPVNDKLFPDLHFGFGEAPCSHTKREVLMMRLLGVLLNKLAANHMKEMLGKDGFFTLKMDASGDPISKPADFVKALVDGGHEIYVYPTAKLTTFGIGLCVKEPDSSWTHIPVGCFLESGYEDSHGNMASAMLPHSGLDMLVSGPLVGKRVDGTPSVLQIQFYVGIEGYCGWKSNENPVVPFYEFVEGPRLSGEHVIRATRLAGLYSNVLNGLATEMKLPFGGYGVTAVCGDSAAVLQQCLYQRNTIYPMTSIGRFMQRTIRYARNMASSLKSKGFLSHAEEQGMNDVLDAMKALPSDINAAPSNAISAAKRMITTMGENLTFSLNVDAKAIMESILEEELVDH